jgi:hypothetical protein
MTLNDSQAIAPACGASLAALKAVIPFGASVETIVYAVIGTVAGFLVTEICKYIKRKEVFTRLVKYIKSKITIK